LDKAEIEAAIRQAVAAFNLEALVEQVRKGEVEDPTAINALGAMLGLTREAVMRLLVGLSDAAPAQRPLTGRFAEVAGSSVGIVIEMPRAKTDDPASPGGTNGDATEPPQANKPTVDGRGKREESTPAGQQRVLNEADVVQAECATVARGAITVGTVDLRCGPDQADIAAIVARVASEVDLPRVVEQLRRGAAAEDVVIQALAKELHLTRASVLRLLVLLAGTEASPERTAGELATLADRHTSLVWRLGQVRSDDPVIGALRDQAAAAIAQDDYPRAETLLSKAEAELKVAQASKPQVQVKNPEPPESELYRALRTFTEVLSLLESNHVDEINPRDVMYGAIRGMLRAADPTDSFSPPDVSKEIQENEWQGTAGVGLELTIQDQQLIVVTPLDGTPAERGGLRPGDRILKIDGQPMPGIPLLDARRRLWGPAGTPVILTLWRQELRELFEVRLIRERVSIRNVAFQDIGDGIAHVRMRHFNKGAAQELRKTLMVLNRQRIAAFVLDLRNNPGGLVQEAIEVVDLFLENGQDIVETRGRVANQNKKFVATGQRIWKGPMAVLVNEGSAGASEIVAGALQDWKRAGILGVPTFGKGFIQTIIPLNDGSELRLSTARYYTPQGHAIQGQGISPGIVVEQPKTKGDMNAPMALRQQSPESEAKALTNLSTDVQLQQAVQTLRMRQF
jgi:carboxyl-terminal processing protease